MTITRRPADFNYFNGDTTLKVYGTLQYATDKNIFIAIWFVLSLLLLWF